MKTKIITLALCLTSFWGLGQKNITFKSIEEIETAVPDSVYYIHIDCKEKVAPDLSKYSSYKNIISIRLQNFGETSLPEWLFKFENLKEIAVTGSKMFPKENVGYTSPFNNLNGISKFKNLEILSIEWTSVSELPDEFLEIKNIKSLHITGSKISTLSKITQWTEKYNECILLQWFYEQFTSKEDVKLLKYYESGSRQYHRKSGTIPNTSYSGCIE